MSFDISTQNSQVLSQFHKKVTLTSILDFSSAVAPPNSFFDSFKASHICLRQEEEGKKHVSESRKGKKRSEQRVLFVGDAPGVHQSFDGFVPARDVDGGVVERVVHMARTEVDGAVSAAARRPAVASQHASMAKTNGLQKASSSASHAWLSVELERC